MGRSLSPWKRNINMKKCLCVTAHLHAKPSQLEAVLSTLEILAVASRSEKDNISYEMCRDMESPNKILVSRSIEMMSAFDLHIQSSHFQAASKQLAELLIAAPEIRRYRSIGVSED
uniref:Antibiotic biosynthesis monooxygenase n=1 Tax=Alteromonadaceae bacterium PE-TB08W TaxID=1199097 RepID=A0A3G9EEY9_9ALTE|nr:antibiotic biosynthesis monooxygenase [Alteromonadaceae bacterium PE-TB08W]